MLRRTWFIGLLILATSACQTEAPQPANDALDTRGVMSKKDKNDCEANNGVVVNGLLGQSCAKKLLDAGKSCTTGTDCQGMCLATDGGGQCSPMTPYFGCHQILLNGDNIGICVD